MNGTLWCGGGDFTFIVFEYSWIYFDKTGSNGKPIALHLTLWPDYKCPLWQGRWTDKLNIACFEWVDTWSPGTFPKCSWALSRSYGDAPGFLKVWGSIQLRLIPYAERIHPLKVEYTKLWNWKSVLEQLKSTPSLAVFWEQFQMLGCVCFHNMKVHFFLPKRTSPSTVSWK